MLVPLTNSYSRFYEEKNTTVSFFFLSDSLPRFPYELIKLNILGSWILGFPSRAIARV